VTWNLLGYSATPGNNTITQRQAAYRTVMAGIGADVVITQDMTSIASRDSFLTNVLNVIEPGQWAASNAIEVESVLNFEYMAVFWKPSKVNVTSIGSFKPPSGRGVLQCLVRPVGYLTNPAWFRLYSVHLRGEFFGADSATRRLECTEIRTTINNTNQTAVGPNFLIGGDMSFLGSYEGGYVRLTELQADNDGRCVDPVPAMGGGQNWHDVVGWSVHYTESACQSCPSYNPGPGFTNGGLDDRFDLILSSTGIQDAEGLDVHAYFAYGNDGLHYNDDINDYPPNGAVSLEIANALWAASDRLPVVMDLRLPSRVSAVSQINFPTVIQGATPHDQNLTVNNAAAIPGDDLDYSLSVAAPYSAPPGSFSAAAGAGNLHTLSLSTATAGSFATPLTLATDDPDSLIKAVLVSGRVLRHAVASLDSGTVVAEDTLKFVGQAPGSVLDRTLRVHDRGYDALQARLSLDNAEVTGGGGRFTIAGGFTPLLVGAIGHSYTVHFDTTGMVHDTTYKATLVISTSDEPLPGGIAASDLVLHLVAGTHSTVGVPGENPPTQLAFYPPRPNPLRGGSTAFGFDLPRPTRVSLAVYDAGGRRIARLIDGERPAGHESVRWNGRDDNGAVAPAGLYFIRFTTPGLQRSARVVILP
jgi:hypothetical protein